MKKKNQKAATGEKKNSLLVILLMLIAVGGCALAGYTFYEMKNLRGQVAGNSKVASGGKSAEVVAPIYVPMDTFTVSLKPEGEDLDRVLYVGITLRVNDEQSKKLAEQFLPDIRSRLFILLSHQTAKSLSTEEGKSNLIGIIKKELGKPVSPHQNIFVSDVLFNAFILR